MKAEISYLKQLSWLQPTVLLFGYILAGWLLSDYNVPWFIWLGTEAVTVHLAWVGFDAVAIATAWIVSLIWAGAFSRAWFRSIPWAGISVWATTLASLWFVGLMLVLALAQTEAVMRSNSLKKSQTFWILVVITWLGLGIGRLANSILIPGISY